MARLLYGWASAALWFSGGCTDITMDVLPHDTVDTEDTAPETYAGGWYKAACAENIDGTGTAAGDIAFDFTQPDQFGESLRLHDFCDRTVLLIGAAFW
jgi:hypothetical protein